MTIDVVIPVYRGSAITRRCIESVMSSSVTVPFELVVVNDDSPEAELVSYLHDLQSQSRITLIENPANLGFVGAVNRAFMLHQDRDVVVLNSDTEVANDWLDRLQRCALSRHEIGSVTPFSNNATICSYPEFCRENDLPPGVDLGDLDRIFRRINAGRVIEIPTAVGFCMYIKRACLNEVGLFDAEHFGKGYGEENDFSMRAAKRGWLNVLCADTFVFHKGGASFQSEKTTLEARAWEVMRKLHPDYEEKLRLFVIRDPLQELRQAIDIELVMRHKSSLDQGKIKSAIALAPSATMKTIACLYVEPDTAGFEAETIECIASNCLTCAAIVVASLSAENLDRDAMTTAARGISLIFVSGDECQSAVESCLRDSGAVGMFLVSAGMYLPYAFDVRLAKIAMQDGSVDTVSPFCDSSAIHRLREFPVTEKLSTPDVSRLDRLAFLLGQKTYFEVTECLVECCFIPAATIERLARQQEGPGKGAPALFRQLSEPGLVHVISDSVYVSTLQSATIPAAAAVPRQAAASRAEPLQLAQSRETIFSAYRTGADFRSTPGLDPRPVQLHVIHGLGGGSTKWLKDYCLADSQRINVVLRAFFQSNAIGSGVALYSHVLDEVPLKVWKFSNEIQATVVTHLEYRRILEEVISEWCVDAVLVSSFIGHSLDVLNTGLPTVVVNHDYFPYCPAINIFFGGVCKQCDERRVGECYRDNPKFNPFVTFLPSQRVRVRHRFMDLIRRANVIMAAPSRSVEDNLVRLNERFREVSFITIPHGDDHVWKKIDAGEPPSGDRLRILVLGELSEHKGLELLRASLGALTEFAEVFLVGCRERGELFKFHSHVHVVSHYEIDELPGHVAAINPHVGLLTSVWPETFSYTLSELMMLGVPVAATRVGSFVERIRHQESGYLYEPDVESLVGALRVIDADRYTLRKIRKNLLAWEPRTAQMMVSDYHRIVPIDEVSCARYPLRRTSSSMLPVDHSGRDAILLTQTLTISSMWKDVQSLRLQLSMSNEAAQRIESQRQLSESSFDRERQELHEMHEQINNLASTTAGQAKSLVEKEGQIQTLSTHLHVKETQLAEVFSSTSWRVSLPVRRIGQLVRRLKILGRCLMPVIRNPASAPTTAKMLFVAWRAGGLLGVKSALVSLPFIADHQDAWEKYHETFRREVRPRIIRRIREMPVRPLVSIIVPTYNTPEIMLKEMLKSVEGQLYPNWELCIADDGSSEPHVSKILEEYVAKDRRIRLNLGQLNRGVSHASNRALEMAAGEIVVLLDHDDLLEEQALFRIVESFLDDNPDMVYSDEVIVTPDAAEVMQYAYRPAFSPALLRSHPYIVHLVGFRTQLLRDLGGFDENLRISQDYDLILRAAEKAQTIVHIPEILYQWRFHGKSTGHHMMHEVMETSKAILQRHLERCGETGRIDDGAGFNLFDARYPLGEGLRVAVIIPTKNHGDLLRQCIESIRATVSRVQYDIVVIDHESEDAETLAYLASISPGVRVIHYQGPFNFSAINNWAVSHLDGSYSHYLLCNNDIEATESGWLERMLELGQHPSVGIVGAKLLYPDRKTIQHAGVCVGAYGSAEHYGKFLRLPEDLTEPGFYEVLVSTHEVAAVTAACLLIRKEAFDEVSGFDEALAVGFGDVDLCLRIVERGFRVLYCPHAQLVHHESYTRGKSTEDPHPQDTVVYRSKWQKLLLAGDPYFNPGRSLQSTSWQVKLPLNCSFGIRRRVFARDAISGRQKLTHSQ